MEPINTIPLQQFIQKVRSADNSNAREIKLDIVTAKNLAFTLGIVMSRLDGDLEKMMLELSKNMNNNDITISLDGGSGFR